MASSGFTLATTFASLGERDFRWYFVGNLTFFMAMQMQFVLRGYLAFDITGAAYSLGLIALAISLPMLLVAPLGGVVADRLNKKMLLIVSQTVAALASVLITVLMLADLIEFWHLLAVSLLTGVVFAFNMPARSALVPLLVPQHKLMNAISLQMGGMNLTRIVAPATAGVLIAPLGVGWVYFITACLFLLAVVSEFQLPKHGLTAMARDTGVFQEFAEGLSFVTRHHLIGLLVLTSLLVPLFGFPVQQMLPVFSEEVFEVGPSGLGLLAAMTGVGGLVGAVISANMDRQPSKGSIMFFGGLIMGAFLLLFALSPSFILALAFIGAAGVGQMLFMTTNNTVVQASLPDELRGRVNSLSLMSFGVMPLAVLPLTVAADRVGAPLTIAASSGVFIALLILLFALVGRLRNLRMDALTQADLSPAQAAALAAEGKISLEDARRLSGRGPGLGL
jgi:MFS transporter, DHA1 family, staphyloferrin A biosynthesis exporter